MAGLNSLAGLLGSPNPQPPNSLFGLLDALTDTFPRFEVYRDDAFEWRWRFRANNYKTIADSGEGYKNYGDAMHAINLMRQCFKAPVRFGGK